MILEKKYQIKTDIKKVFRALTDPIEIEQWSGSEAIMENFEGGSFSLWGGSILGINKEISENEIHQLWKESTWNDYSNVEFHLGEEEGQTILKLEHSNIPNSSIEDIDKGWDEYYLKPLKLYLEQ